MEQTTASRPLSDAPDTQPFLLAGDELGVVLLHGFTSTPQSMHYVGHALHARSGATILVPCLAGHGITPEALAQTGYKDWLASADAAVDQLRKDCRRIVVAGLSLGGTLALNLAARQSDRIDAVITINGSTGIYKPDVARLLFDEALPDHVPGIGSDIRHPERQEVCYDRIPTSTLTERFLLTNATGSLLSLIRQPILVMQSRIDHVVNTENAMRIVREVSSDDVRLSWLSKSYHVATLDHDRDRIVEEAADFLSRFAGPKICRD